jgi:flavin reductase (DIM6/NTAB) family NADH-FMN oxidoreductase RutF/DNA-binding IclR family transcriptional regulator
MSKSGHPPAENSAGDTAPSIQPDHFRRVLGHFPTGVTVITSVDLEGAPVGMSVGSFSSVSLDPPLVAFYPDRGSSTFPRIAEGGSFCVNILADDQEWICRQMARKGAAKFESVDWTPAPSSGAPTLTGCVGWIDCDIEEIRDAGDHFLVIGRVRDLQVASEAMPLLFFQGGYGRFSTSSLAMPAQVGIGDRLRVVDRARPEMERLSAATGAGCLALIEGGHGDLVVAASTRQSRRGAAPTQVGQHVPFTPPLGALFVAWASLEEQEAWLAEGTDPAQRDALRRGLERIRHRGFSLRADGPFHADLDRALARLQSQPELQPRVRQLLRQVTSDFEPESLELVQAVRQVAAPVLAPSGRVVMTLNVFGLPSPTAPETLAELCTNLREATGRVSALLAQGSDEGR